MKNFILSGFLAIMLASIPAYAASDHDIVGIWNNEEKNAKIEIFKCAEKYCGRIVWLKVPSYPADSKDGVPGTPKVDKNNPVPAFRARPILGLEILQDFTYKGESKWTDGRVYDPENGKIYSANMTLVSPNQLDLRGFIGISLLGRTTTWTR
ncbi:MAG TPA: DUF2147 domain-containing protein [Nitrospirota bacterium]|nr:DUF2147 domain-containing protein [Nitrospirota bacterium]